MTGNKLCTVCKKVYLFYLNVDSKSKKSQPESDDPIINTNQSNSESVIITNQTNTLESEMDYISRRSDMNYDQNNSDELRFDGMQVCVDTNNKENSKNCCSGCGTCCHDSCASCCSGCKSFLNSCGKCCYYCCYYCCCCCCCGDCLGAIGLCLCCIFILPAMAMGL